MSTCSVGGQRFWFEHSRFGIEARGHTPGRILRDGVDVTRLIQASIANALTTKNSASKSASNAGLDEFFPTRL
jgi:hypothetical protein